MAADVVEIVSHFLARLFLEIILEIAIKGPGYTIVRMLTFSKNKKADPDGLLVAMAGIIFWLAIGLCIY